MNMEWDEELVVNRFLPHFKWVYGPISDWPLTGDVSFTESWIPSQVGHWLVTSPWPSQLLWVPASFSVLSILGNEGYMRNVRGRALCGSLSYTSEWSLPSTSTGQCSGWAHIIAWRHGCQRRRWGLGYWSGEAWLSALTFQEEGAKFRGDRTFSWQRHDAEKSWTTVIVEASAQTLCIATLTFCRCRQARHGSGNELVCSISLWERGGVNNCEW